MVTSPLLCPSFAFLFHRASRCIVICLFSICYRATSAAICTCSICWPTFSGSYKYGRPAERTPKHDALISLHQPHLLQPWRLVRYNFSLLLCINRGWLIYRPMFVLQVACTISACQSSRTVHYKHCILCARRLACQRDHARCCNNGACTQAEAGRNIRKCHLTPPRNKAGKDWYSMPLST